jgi:HEAT repeat protein/cytochrome c554/c'-like protein
LKRTSTTEVVRHQTLVRAAPFLLPIAAAVMLVVWLTWPPPRQQDSADRRTPGQLADAIASGETHAVATAMGRATDNSTDLTPLLRVMLTANAWQCRRTACEMVAARGDASLLPIIVPRASDTDWRVRAAAFDALNRFGNLPGSAPLKDTPLAARERVLLAWLEAHDRSAATALLPDLCELYAGTVAVEFGKPLASRCLGCHVGRQGKAFDENASCGACHGRVHSEWSGSSHGQSLSHLRLMTVNAKTRQPEPMDFGPVRGISCTQCHRVSAGPKSASADAGRRPRQCPWSFDPAAKPREACRQCHRSTTRQWLAWRDGPQPRRLDWPPGKLDLDHRGDTRDCTDCHMNFRDTSGSEPEGRRHTWFMRRNVTAMRRAIDLRAERVPAQSGQGRVRITLTNLSGHAFPTGTRRRGLIVLVGPAGGGSWQVAARLSPSRPGQVRPETSPALAPGEQRRLSWPVVDSGKRTAVRLLYVRDLFDDQSYRAEITSTVALPGVQ